MLLPMLALVLEAASKQSSKWMEMVSNRSLASDLVESAALARVLPLLAADPKISPADVYAKTQVRTTQASLDDAAAHVLAATKAFDQLSGAGFDAVRSQQRQTMPKAPAASKVAATAAAPLSAPFPTSDYAGKGVAVGAGASVAAAAAAKGRAAVDGDGSNDGMEVGDDDDGDGDGDDDDGGSSRRG